MPPKMFRNYTDRSLLVMIFAQEEARKIGHRFIDSELILIGLLAENTGKAAEALKAMGLSLDSIRVEVKRTLGENSSSPESTTIMGINERLIILIHEEAERLGSGIIDTEQILFGLLRYKPEQRGAA